MKGGMPLKQPNATLPAYRLRMENGAYVFTFFCMASGAAACTAKPVQAESEAAALQLAWNGEARGEFNFCHRCGKWVADVMYNADTLKCVDCSPWEDKPLFCSSCGAKVEGDGLNCKKCGARLQYGGE